MFFKIIMSNIREFASGDAECQGSILQRPMLWSSVVFLPLAAIGQMYFLESTMGSGGTNYVIPCYTGLIVVGSAVVGGIVFEEFDNIQGTNLALFLVGISWRCERVRRVEGEKLAARARGWRSSRSPGSPRPRSS